MHTVDMGQVLLWESLTPRVAGCPTSRVTGRADTGAVELPTDVGSVEHFLAKCSPPDDAGHVWWLGAIDGSLEGTGGYGRVQVGRGPDAVITAHRYSWTVKHGPVPAGLGICHRCDEHVCVAADDPLEPGTTADNNWAAVLRGRRGSLLDVRGSVARSRTIRPAGRAVLALGSPAPGVVGRPAGAAMADGDPMSDQMSLGFAVPE